MLKPFLAFSILISLIACQSNVSDKTDSESKIERAIIDTNQSESAPKADIDLTPSLLDTPITKEMLIGTYVGKLPCADCSEIDYEITFTEQGGFSENIKYVGKEAEPQQAIGFYEITKDNKIYLGKYTKGMNYLGLAKQGLLMLDINSDMITGPLAGRYLLRAKQEEKIADHEKNNQWYWDNRIEFYSAPNKQNWYLHLSFWGEVVFAAPSGEVYKTLPTEPEMGKNKHTIIMRCTDTWGALQIEINHEQRCLNYLSGDQYDAYLTVSFTPKGGKTQVFKECGNYTVHPELFAHGWKLASINNVAAEEAKYEIGAPILNFDVLQRQFRGHDGCNEVGGGWTVNGNKISFSQFASTAISCPDMTASRDFNFAVQHESFSYVIFDELLTFTNMQNTLVFTKVD